jgi:predicted NAD/FAD-dependent oxidoreductase
MSVFKVFTRRVYFLPFKNKHMKQFDFVVVGSGLFGATFAHQANKMGKRCLVIDKRKHSGGNIFCTNENGINVHFYGAHIFHTNDKKVWDLSINSRPSIVILIHPWLTTRESCIICRSI